MSFGIVRVQKFKAPEVKGIQIHDHRERPSRTNPDIDREKTSQNYALVESFDWNKSIQERLSTLESKKAVRKDAVVMVQVMVTSDHEFFQGLTPEKEKTFFEESLRFIQERYGAENIFSAVVHKDEKTPHMHVNLTPIRKHRLTAKEIFNRKDVTSLHTDFNTAVGKNWGLKRGESREEKRRHLDTEAFKLETRWAELEKRSMVLTPVQVKLVQPEDVTPRQLGSKMLGLVKEQENPEMVAARVNKEFIQSIADNEAISAIPILRVKIRELEAKWEEQEPKLKLLDSYQQAYSNGLTKSQQEALISRANEFRAENMRKAEKERQEAAEREKRAQEEKAERERQAEQLSKERQAFEFKYGRFAKQRWGKEEDNRVAVAALVDEWEKAPDKETFIKLLPERFPALKRENERKARSLGPSMGR